MPVGTGSTAIQIVPAIIDQVAHVTLFQRTAQWILPLPNPAYTEAEKAKLRGQPGRLAEAYQTWSDRIRTTIVRAVRNGQPMLWPWSLERFQGEMAAPNLDEYAIA